MMFGSLGFEVSEEFLSDYLQADRCYDPMLGTDVHSLDDSINRLADTAGWPVTATEVNGFDTDRLRSMLDEGIRPLIVVDAAELYGGPDALLNQLGVIPDCCHAVQLTAIEHGPDGSHVVLNDPGRWEDGAGFRVSLDGFNSATDDYGNTAIALKVA
jgi:hypothetical protein